MQLLAAYGVLLRDRLNGLTMDGKPLPAGAGGVPGPVAGAAEFSGALQVVARQFVCVIPGDIDFTRHRVAGFGVLVLDAHLQRLPAISVPIAFDVAMVNRKRPAMPAALCIPDLKAAVLRAMLDKKPLNLITRDRNHAVPDLRRQSTSMIDWILIRLQKIRRRRWSVSPYKRVAYGAQAFPHLE